MIKIKRVYDPPEISDGKRYLIDRLWPRGLIKEGLKLTGWIKEAAPGSGLRRSFGHDPAKWKEFQRRYSQELEANPLTWQPLLEAARKGDITLIFGARDTMHNNAVVLKAFLEDKLQKSRLER